MFRLLLLLSATMFTTMLIGGQDHGQMRQGLMLTPPAVAANPVVKTPEPAVILTNFTPKVPAPKAPVVAAPAPAPVVARVEAVASPAEAQALPVSYVNTNSLNVREGPSTDTVVVGRLSRGEAVSVVSEQDGWYRIKLEGDGIEGFVAARLMTDKTLDGN